MSGSDVLLDTNIIIALFNSETKIAEKLDKLNKVYVPCIVAGELYYGANASKSKAKNISKINLFLDNCSVLQIDNSTAHHYGEIKAILRKKGTPIPENDIWIAAISVQHNLTLITRDAHFKMVEIISIASW